MIVLKIILFSMLFNICYCRIPDKVNCANQECSDPISKATTLINYNSPDPNFMSFRGKSEAIIYMKSAGSNPDIWYASINGKSGFVSSKFLRENKVYTRELIEVPVGIKKEKPDVQPDKVQQAHEVFEGTTIYTTEPSTESVDENGDLSSTADTVISPTESPSSEETEYLDKNLPKSISSDNIEVVLNQESTKAQNTDGSDNPSNIDYNKVLDMQESHTSSVVKANNNVIDKVMEQTNDMMNNEKELVNDKSSDSLNENEKKSIDNKDSVNIHKINVPESLPLSVTNLEFDANEQNESTKTNNENTQNTITKELLNMVNSEENSNKVDDMQSLNNPTKSPLTDSLSSESSADVTVTYDNPLLETSTEISSPIGPDNVQAAGDSKELIKDNSKNVNVNTNTNENLHIGYLPMTTEQPDTSTEPSIHVPDETQPTPDVSISYDSSTKTIPAADINLLLQEMQNADTTTQRVYKVDVTTEVPLVTESSTKEEVELGTITEAYMTTSTDDLIEEVFTSSTTERPVAQESEGLFSNIYSTIADIIPPTTEAPEPIFNPDHVQPLDNEESFSFLGYLFSTITSVMGTREQSEALFASVRDTCFTNDYCDGESFGHRNRLLAFLLTSASSVLLFTLGYYYIDNKRQDSRFIGTINKLQRELLFASKECEILKEELLTTKSKLTSIEDNSFGMDDMVQSLKEEIKELKAQNERLRNSLDDNEKLLRVSENTAGELQNTLSEVENTLSELLNERAHSEEQIAELNGKIQAFEEELISVSRDRDNYQLKYASAETALEDLKKQHKEFDEINILLSEANNTIELQKHEIVALKDAIKELKSGAISDVDVSSLIDHTEIKAKLTKALQERESFMSKYEVEHKERACLVEELKTTRDSYKTASQQATEAVTRLEVLEKYFQDRECELLKELSAKESLWLSKQGESASTVEKIELLQQEVQRFKEKCDTLTLELAEQESSRRTAIGEIEARAHAAWLEARQARREADAAKDEATALRRKLAALHHADGAASPHRPAVASPLEVPDGLAGALPPLAFLPPPLLPPLPRPPPLGRLPSPHAPRYSERRYSPDSRYSPGSRYSPESRYSPDTVRYSPERRYSPRARREPYSPRSRRRSSDRYVGGRGSRSRNGPGDTETEYNSDSPARAPRRRRYTRSGASSGSECSSGSEK